MATSSNNWQRPSSSSERSRCGCLSRSRMGVEDDVHGLRLHVRGRLARWGAYATGQAVDYACVVPSAAGGCPPAPLSATETSRAAFSWSATAGSGHSAELGVSVVEQRSEDEAIVLSRPILGSVYRASDVSSPSWPLRCLATGRTGAGEAHHERKTSRLGRVDTTRRTGGPPRPPRRGCHPPSRARRETGSRGWWRQG